MIIIFFSWDYDENFEVFYTEDAAISWMREELGIPDSAPFNGAEWQSAALEGYQHNDGKSFVALEVDGKNVKRWRCGL